MKLPCDVVTDLITIYHDRMAGEETIKAVEEHLEDCEVCRELYESYSMAEDEFEDAILEGPEEHMRQEFEQVARRQRRRRYFYAGAAAVYIIFSIAIYVYVLLDQLKERKYI